MSKNNNNKDKKDIKNKKSKKATFMKSLKVTLLVLLLFAIVAGGALGGIVISIIKEAPEIDPVEINSTLSQTSTIYDSNEKLMEKIDMDTGEYSTFVNLNKMPQHLQDAFISIEDERFTEHKGIDPKGIIGSLFENLKSGGIKRGASTITQQLVKNVYLTNEQKLSRKIKEAYLSLQVEKVLHKDQILEAYLNRNFFGQNATGVQEAAQTYFSKDVEELTLAESALFAGIVKSPVHYQPFQRIKAQEYDDDSQVAIGEVNVLGEKYILVFNEDSVERQRLVLQKMLDLGKISQAEYDEALNEDIKESLKPGQKKMTDITSYFTDYVKSQVVNSLITKLDYSREDAEDLLYKGGLKIYSTVDISLQKQLEDVYENFTEVLIGKAGGSALINWNLNGAGDIRDDKGKIIFYKKNNLLDEDFNLIIRKGNYSISDNGDIIIKDKKLNAYKNHIDIADYYTTDDKKNLVTHTVGSFDISEDNFKISENKDVIITKEFLDEKDDFSQVDDNGNLVISEKYFYIDKEGIVQPQSSTVVLDYRSGQIKAIVGGRDVEGNRLLNRATNATRQPGSVIKPLSAYLPALDNGYTAASAIDDVPLRRGKWNPRNSYRGFKGIRTIRAAVEDSGNIPSIKTVENIGIDTSKAYLEKLGIINKQNGEKDNFVTAAENVNNDENPAALGLGGMTNGLTPLEVTAAYGAIANNGVYVEPIAFTKILDKDGNVLLENTPRETTVVSPQVSYVMSDILRTNVTSGYGRNAQLSNMVTAGKTGTTQDKADIWFVGFTPYYATGVWIGNDAPKITLTQSSPTAASFWKHIMTKAHDGLDGKSSFNRPDGILSASVCTQSGKRATKLCAQDPRHIIKNEIFAKGTMPSEYCDVHVSERVDKSTDKIANKYCPNSLVVQRVYVKTDPIYKPWENSGIIPRDYAYRLPAGVCNVHGPGTVEPEEPSENDNDEEEVDDNDNEENNQNDNDNQNNEDNQDNNDNQGNNDNQNNNGGGDNNITPPPENEEENNGNSEDEEE